MSNELIVIEAGTELAVFTSTDDVDLLIERVKENVMSLEGGSMKNKTSRNKIRSNAFKATKAKTAFKINHIQPLLESLQAKIQPVIDTIAIVKSSEKRLYAGLDQVRKDVNQEVDELEAELQRVEDEAAKKAEDEAAAAQLESDHEVGLLMNEKFDRDLADQEAEAERQRIEDARIAKEERDRREEAIRVKAAEDAKLKAEQDAANKIAAEKAKVIAAEAAAAKAKQDVIDANELAEQQRQAAIQAEIELEEAAAEKLLLENQAKEAGRVDYHKRFISHIIDCGNGILGGQVQGVHILLRELEMVITIDDSFEEFKDEALREKAISIKKLNDFKAKEDKKAEDQRVAQESDRKEADKQARIQADAAADHARLDEVERQASANKAEADKLAAREANKQHIGKIRKAQKEYLMSMGIAEDIAKNVVIGIANGEMPSCKVIY